MPHFRRALPFPFSLLAVLTLLTGSAAFAFKEYPIGHSIEINNMLIAAVYLKPVDMEPRGLDLPASQADIHLECDVHATPGNPNGFGVGEWIPYLTVSYTMLNLDTGKSVRGVLMPMVAADGPHYGSNIKMPGPGNYKLSYAIDPPSKQGFGRHMDAETGVGKWFKPFTIDFEFQYLPLNP